MLSAGDEAVGLEQLEEDADDIALHKARRFGGSMSAMSGANGMVYMEYRYANPVPPAPLFLSFFFTIINNLLLCSTGRHKLGKGQMKSKPKDPAKRHHLFKRRFG